jgi:hypothetical protein
MVYLGKERNKFLDSMRLDSNSLEVCKLHFYPDGNDGKVACMVQGGAELHDINGTMCFSAGGKHSEGPEMLMCLGDPLGEKADDLLNVCGQGMVLAMSKEGVLMCVADKVGGGEEEEEEQEEDGPEEEDEEVDAEEEEEADQEQDGAEEESAAKAGKVHDGLVCYVRKAEDVSQCFSDAFMIPKSKAKEISQGLTYYHDKETNRIALCTMDALSNKLMMCVGMEILDRSPYDTSSLCAPGELPVLKRDGTFDCKAVPGLQQLGEGGKEQAAELEGQVEMETQEEVEDEVEDEVRAAVDDVSMQAVPSTEDAIEQVMPGPIYATSHQLPMPPYMPPKNYAYAYNSMSYASTDLDLAAVYINRMQFAGRRV